MIERIAAKLALWFEQATCRPHDIETLQREEEGVCLGWDLRPDISFRLTGRCKKCGKVVVDKGMLLPLFQRFHPERYGADGWPLTVDGKRMDIAP